MNDLKIIELLYRHKLRLLVVVLAVGILASLITLLIPNIYSSTAVVSVQKPQVTITGEVPPLNVETLQALVASTRVKWELFQKLTKEGIIGSEIDFPRFQNMITTAVERDQSRERLLLPMVKLTATTKDPDLSMAIANLWTAVVFEQTRRIYQSGVDDLSLFTTNIYEKVNKTLLESEELYTEKLLQSNLTVNQITLQKNKALYTRLSEETLNLRDEAATRRALLEKNKAVLAEQEIDGEWIGEFYSRQRETDPAYEPPDVSPLAERIIRTIRSLDKNERALAEFEEKSQIDYKYMMVQIKSNEIADISQSILSDRTQLSGAVPTYAKLKEELAAISPKTVLLKAIGDDKLWEDFLQEQPSKLGQISGMKTEESNPIYQETEKELMRLSGEIIGLGTKIKDGEGELEKLRREISELRRDIAPLETKRNALLSSIKKDRELLAHYLNAYNQGRQNYETGERELGEIEVRLALRQEKLGRLEKEIVELEKSVYIGENEIARRRRDVDNLIQVRASLAAKAEEVALLKVSMENISRSGVILLYPAQADPIKVGPHRARIVLISILSGFLLYSLILVLGAVVRQDEPENIVGG